MTKCKLGDICEIVSGSTPKTSIAEYWDGDVKWITPAELSDDTYIIMDSVRKITKLAVEKTGLRSIPKGTVILSSRAPIGKVAIAGCELYCNQGFKNLICSDVINNKYLYWFLRGNTIFLNSLGRGATFKEISKSIVSEIEINIPSIMQQKKVVENLEKLNGIISIRKQELQLLDQLVRGRFVELFGEYYMNHINEKQLDEICDFIDYRGKTPEKSESGIPLITAKNVKDNRFSIEPQEFIPEENYDAVMTRGIPRVNDVLFTTEAPLGNVCRIPDIYERFCVGQRLITMQPHTDVINSEYLEHALASAEFQEKMWQKSSGSTVKGIRSKLLVLLTIPVPPIELQNQFRDFVHQVDKSKLIVQKELDETQLLFDSLMQEYFG